MISRHFTGVRAYVPTMASQDCHGMGGVTRGFPPVVPRFIDEDLSFQCFDTNRAIWSDKIIVALGSILSHGWLVRVLHARILLRWIHTTVGSPAIRIERNS